MRLIGLDSSAEFMGSLQVASLLDELETSQVVLESLMADLVEEHLFTYLLIVIKLERVILLGFAQYDSMRVIHFVLWT